MGKATTQNPDYLYCINHTIWEENKMFVQPKQFLHKYNLSLCFRNHLRPTLSQFFYFPSPYFLAQFLRELTHIQLGNSPCITTQSIHRPSADCMHHLYNSENYTTDTTLSLNSNLNKVFLWTDMHELFMSDSLLNWWSSEVALKLIPTTRPSTSSSNCLN